MVSEQHAQLSCWIPADLMRRLRVFAAEHGIPINQIVAIAIAAALEAEE